MHKCVNIRYSCVTLSDERGTFTVLRGELGVDKSDHNPTQIIANQTRFNLSDSYLEDTDNIIQL